MGQLWGMPSTSAITWDMTSTSANAFDTQSTWSLSGTCRSTFAHAFSTQSTSASAWKRPSTSDTTWGRPSFWGDVSSSYALVAIENFIYSERLQTVMGTEEQGLEKSSVSLVQRGMIRNQHNKIQSMYDQDGTNVPTCDLEPKVLLTDIRSSLNSNILSDTPPRTLPDNEGDAPAPSPSRSSLSLSPSPPSTSRRRPRKRKRTSDASVEYEVEAVLGYHRDKRNRMSYLIKWKDWDEKYNTFEPISNLTSCHYELMRYFEVVPPSQEELKKKKKFISRGMKELVIYKRFIKHNYRAKDLDYFSKNCLDLSQLFEASDLAELERQLREEYGFIIRCLIGMCHHQDTGLVRRAQNYRLFLKLIKVRRRQLVRISNVELQINASEATPLKIENNVDMETFPNIEYSNHMKYHEGIVIPQAILGCECTECAPRGRCCGKLSDSAFAYGANGRLRVSDRIPIYECNICCKCPATCGNRIVQRGRRVRLCIFKTRDKGWGVKALERIPKGTFVCQYIGEMIPDSEAVVRDVRYTQCKKSGYMFDLDFFEDTKLEMFCIDATEYGNVSRFINHSCDPNLAVYPVWVDNPAPNMHYLAFFAKRNIAEGEEINFDYENVEHRAKSTDQEKPWAKVVAIRKCQCGAPNCREWVFGNK